MKIEAPEFLLEMSKQMSEQPNRCTAHPFWQVRCKRYIVTEQGYDEHHWILLADDDGEFYRSDKDGDVNEVLLERFPEFCTEWSESEGEDFVGSFDIEYCGLPSNVRIVYVQEVEEVVTTHFTESDALWFIKRKQHDYPKLYTWVESAYWSPQLRELQDWIMGLASEEREGCWTPDVDNCSCPACGGDNN